MHTRVLLALLIAILGSTHSKAAKIDIQIINDQVYQHTSYQEIKPWGMVATNGLVMIDKNEAYIIDTPWTEEGTEQLVKWLRAKNLTPKAAIISHYHQDASNGIAYLTRNGIPTYANQLTNQLLSKHKRMQSSHSITEPHYSLANQQIEVFYPGAGHTTDNIVVWLPNQKLLFGGCFVKSLDSKNLGNLADANVKQWPESITHLLTKYPNIKQVVPGHGKLGGIELLKHTAQLATNTH
ncbi:beta-lactamase [Pseudoalteromonas sp. A25]|uniref:subclass B1 metallo-beta-lactamase n=1 Tax=Pseudoalteromonas sp. A25 TaxID=116092 RepID=UPI0012605285|nr:subclass B1 metallo-beta-lactamase [Pseudoalteromonas sp. A25]BBN83534.1 beta-lactamase [Pseudoalteromonas sp. A25]